MPTPIWVRGENGSRLIFDADRMPPGIQHRLNRGDLLRINEDGTPWTEGQEPAAAVAPPLGDEVPTGPEDAPPLPKASAARKVWQDFAVSQGLDLDEAAQMSKQELIDRLSPPAGDED